MSLQILTHTDINVNQGYCVCRRNVPCTAFCPHQVFIVVYRYLQSGVKWALIVPVPKHSDWDASLQLYTEKSGSESTEWSLCFAHIMERHNQQLFNTMQQNKPHVQHYTTCVFLALNRFMYSVWLLLDMGETFLYSGSTAIVSSFSAFQPFTNTNQSCCRCQNVTNFKHWPLLSVSLSIEHLVAESELIKSSRDGRGRRPSELATGTDNSTVSCLHNFILKQEMRFCCFFIFQMISLANI